MAIQSHFWHRIWRLAGFSPLFLAGFWDYYVFNKAEVVFNSATNVLVGEVGGQVN